jgi:hypothetical protein
MIKKCSLAVRGKVSAPASRIQGDVKRMYILQERYLAELEAQQPKD